MNAPEPNRPKVRRAWLEAKAGLLHGIRLRNVSVNRTIGIMTVRMRALSPLANRFIDVLREVARGIH